MIQVIGTGLVLVTAALAAVAAGLQWTVRPRFWTTPVGRLMAALLGVIAAVLALSTVRAVTGAELDTTWFALLRLVVFACVPVVLVWCISIQFRLRRQAQRARRRLNLFESTRPGPRPGASPTHPREGMTVFKRDPSLYITAIAAILGVGVSLGLRGLDAHQAAAIMAVITAAGGVWTAVHTRPVPPSLFTSFLGALALLLAAYTIDIPQETLAAVQVAVSSLVGILTWQSVSPKDSVARFTSVGR